MIYLQLFLSFLVIGFSSFGGLTMVPLINEQMLSHGWMTEQEVSDIVAIAEMTPGPLGLNCATFAGSRTAGVPGAFVASVGVLVPSVTLCLLAAVFFVKFRESKVMSRALYGIRAGCIGMIASVVLSQALANYAGSGALGISWDCVVIGAAALFLFRKFKMSVPKVILICAASGLICGILKL